MNVGIYTKPDTLEDKLEGGKKSEDRFAYWMFKRGVPECFDQGDKLFVAVGGKWKGYFADCTVGVLKHEKVEAICFISENWVELPEEHQTERKPFQGFTKEVPTAKGNEKEVILGWGE